MRKVACLAFVLVILFSTGFVSSVSADSSRKGYYHGDLKDKFFRKAHFMLENSDELGLSDEQTGKIIQLKIETKKNLIRQEADIAIAAIDIKSKLMEDKIDVDAVKPLIDKKYAYKKAKAHSLVDSFSKLKATLTDEQRQNLHRLWKSKK